MKKEIVEQAKRNVLIFSALEDLEKAKTFLYREMLLEDEYSISSEQVYFKSEEIKSNWIRFSKLAKIYLEALLLENLILVDTVTTTVIPNVVNAIAETGFLMEHDVEMVNEESLKTLNDTIVSGISIITDKMKDILSRTMILTSEKYLSFFNIL